MQLIQEPDWPSLAGLHRGHLSEAGQLLNTGDFEGAAAGYERAYRALLVAQPEGRRFHKGESLHNLGLALLWLGRTDEARQRTLEAFVEDSASQAEESPQYEELDRPAAHNLVYVFGFAGQALAILSRFVRDYVQSGNLLPDPRPFLETNIRALSPPPALPGGLKIIGQHRLPPEYRVFVGGGFAHLDSHLRPMRDIITPWTTRGSSPRTSAFRTGGATTTSLSDSCTNATTGSSISRIQLARWSRSRL